jgi:CheY-like chemotaxis protein
MPAKPILLADDDADQAFLAVRAFRQAGAANAVVTVGDGAQAIDYLGGVGRYADRAAHPLPCLVLLDQKLPGRSGLEVLEWLRAQPALCTLPALLLTSSTYESDVRTAYLLGANGYLVKPATFEDMLRLAAAIKDYWLTMNRGA